MSSSSVITVYTRQGCPPCRQTKRMMDKLGIEYVEVGLDDNDFAQEFVKGLGYKTAPVVVTDDDHWGGFNPNNIRKLVGNGK